MSWPTIADRLTRDLRRLRFSAPVTHVYNPLDYARASCDAYFDRYGGGRRSVLLVGMNPGPWGMAQTGVPFGEVAAVRDWLKIKAPVDRPANEHPRRPVLGWACERSEVSGRRLWGWVRDRFVTPRRFFRQFFVVNYCPLLFLEESGRNRTPDRLPSSERAPLLAACDRALAATVDLLEPDYVIGVGKFAALRAETATRRDGVTFGSILHPSPASPAANRDWAGTVTRQFGELGIAVP